MTKAEQEMLDLCGGDRIKFNNWIKFANFICDMIEKYGDEVFEEAKERKQSQEEST